jgi:hypothetical protein
MRVLLFETADPCGRGPRDKAEYIPFNIKPVLWIRIRMDSYFLVDWILIQNWIRVRNWIRIRIDLNCWIRIRIETIADPQHRIKPNNTF